MRMSPRDVAANPGLLKAVISRTTGRTVSVYDGEQQGEDVSEGRWFVVCEEHGCHMCCRNKKLALRNCHRSMMFCEECISLAYDRPDEDYGDNGRRKCKVY